MPVTKTANRALRSSLRKKDVNSLLMAKLGAKVRLAKKSKKQKDITEAVSMIDKAAKKNIIHKNKASRMKSNLQKLLPKSTKTVKKSTPKPKKPKKK